MGAFIMIIHEKWFSPFITWYIKTSHCHSPFGYSGVSVMWYSLFVGLPSVSALLSGVYLIPIGIKGLIHEQFPPKGVKVYKPTKIIRGWKSQQKSIFCLLFPVFFVAIAVWGYFQVDIVSKQTSEEYDYSVCQIDKNL
jgi:hypothetical protein